MLVARHTPAAVDLDSFHTGLDKSHLGMMVLSPVGYKDVLVEVHSLHSELVVGHGTLDFGLAGRQLGRLVVVQFVMCSMARVVGHLGCMRADSLGVVHPG